MRYIGLDISASETGVSIVDEIPGGNFLPPEGRLRLVWVGTIKTASSQGTGKNKIDFADGERLKIIRESLWEILDKFNPEVFIKEGQGADMNKFRSVSLVSKATGVVEECCQSWWGRDPITIHSYPPSTVKKAVTGFGGVDKSIKGNGAKEKYLKKKPVIDAVHKVFGTDGYSFSLRKLKGDTEKEVYYNDNEADSSAVILTHLKLGGN